MTTWHDFRSRAVVAWILGALLGLLLVFALVIGPWLFTRYPHYGLTAEQELKAKNDVRTTLIQTLGGLAVAGGLIVTYRTYRQNQREQDRTYERELYANAVEQLGHAQATVRLGALYSLQSLAQNKPDRRQTVVEVLCAYLRMPYTPPAGPIGASGSTPQQQLPGMPLPAYDPAQELQVRKTVQCLLATHLQLPANTSAEDAQQRRASAEQTFWRGISLDLTGATLIDFDLRKASVVKATFAGAIFTGSTTFEGTTFNGNTVFNGATFSKGASFRNATFVGEAWFERAVFNENAILTRATFGTALFSRTTFSGNATFSNATFTNTAWFEKTTFTGHASFAEATFTASPTFEGAQFTNEPLFKGAKVRLDEKLDSRRWPAGLDLRRNPDDPTQGILE